MPIMVLRAFLCAGIVVLLDCVSFAAAGTNEEGKKFLAEMAEEPGVVKLPSGLMYKVLKSGNGMHHPTKMSPCLINYIGKLANGKEIENTYLRGKPQMFAPNQVTPGWKEAMLKMVVGDKWELYVPSELAFGDHGAGGMIPASSALVFEVELLKIMRKDEDLPKKELEFV